MVDLKQIQLDAGMYQEAASKGVSFGTWLEEFIVEKGHEPTPFYGMSTGERIKAKLAQSAEGKTVALAAFELLLRAHDIKAFGQITDPISKFFQNSQTSVLFPEFISNRVYAGMLRTGLVEKMIANKVVIQGFEYKKIYLEEVEADRQTSITGRGADIAEARFALGYKSTNLRKYAKAFVVDYAALYNTPINAYSAVLMRIGDQLGIDKTDDLIYVLQNGDGNSNGIEAGQIVTSAATTAISKIDVIGLTSALPLPYQLDVFVGKKAYMRKYWDTLSDMNNPMLQWNVTGMPLPQGLEWDRTILTSDYLLGVDSKRGLEYVTIDAALLTETDRIIKKQQVLTVVSDYSDFAIIDQDAIGCLDIEH